MTSKTATTEPTTVEYMWIPDSWGDDITGAEEERLLALAQAYCDEHEEAVEYVDEDGDTETPSVIVRATQRAGEAPGLYRRERTGGWQILGYSVAKPEAVDDLTSRAWQHAIENLVIDEDA